MKTVDKNMWPNHRARADSFFAGMKTLAADDRQKQSQKHKNAVALLAVHASISLADAVLIACMGMRSNEQDHRAALVPLRKLCGERRIPPEGILHLKWLMEKKTDFAYADKRILADDAKRALQNAERFETWVNKNFLEVMRNDAE